MDDELELQEPYATAIFRIVQESLANVAKHANATDVAVMVERGPQDIVLSVQDDGCGFNAAAQRSLGSLGLMGLHERAQLLKGTVTVASAPGEGTRIDVWIPLAPPATAR